MGLRTWLVAELLQPLAWNHAMEADAEAASAASREMALHASSLLRPAAAAGSSPGRITGLNPPFPNHKEAREDHQEHRNHRLY